jgi:hypothetical protein
MAGSACAQTPALDVPYVPTPMVVVDEMLRLGKVGKDDYLIDLGSGDGRIVVTAAQRFGTRGYGVDINPVRLQEAEENARKAGVTELAKFENRNLFYTDLSKADVLTMYLLSSVNLELRPKILSSMRPGTRVVSHDFDMGEWKPDEEVIVPGDGSPVYLWIVPAQAGGRWTSQIGGQNAEVTLNQRFQMVTGSGRVGDQEVNVQNGRLHGDRIELTLVAHEGGKRAVHRVEGKVFGNSAEGTVSTDGGPVTPWKATRG